VSQRLLAAARVAHISQTSIIAEELRDFFAWRRAPRNRAAYQAWKQTASGRAGVHELDAMAGDDIAQLDPNLLMKAFNQMSDGLAGQARERRAIAERWKANRNPGSTGDEEG
jgi:hypothetical protein